MLYLYAVIDQPGVEFPLPPGLLDSAVEVLPFDGMGLAAGRLMDIPQRNAANAHRHMNVLTALMQKCTVLPAQSGAIFAEHDELRRALAAMQGALAAALLRLRGHVEVSVTATHRRPLILEPVHDGTQLAPVPDTEMGPGRRCVTTGRVKTGQRLRQMRTNEAIAAVVSATLAPLVTSQSWQPLASAAGRAGISAAALVPRTRLEALQRALAGLREQETDIDIRCTGPWPPYSFAGKCGQTLAAWASRFNGTDRIAS
jgi:hypothetical protein